MACGILVSRPGIKPMPPAVQAWSQPLDHQAGLLISHLINPTHIMGVAVYVLSLRDSSGVGVFVELLTMVSVFIHKH